MKQTFHDASAAPRTPASAKETRGLVVGWRGVRYQVQDVARSIEFYTQRLGFKLDAKHLPAFAQVSIGELELILSGPGASGSRPMPDGARQPPGGWNRIVLQVAGSRRGNRGIEEGRASSAQCDGERPGRQAGSDRGPGR